MSRSARHRRPRRRPWSVSVLTGIGVGAVVGAVLTVSGVTVPAAPARADDSSAFTVTAHEDPFYDSAPMPDLKVTVSQTRDLVAQGIQVSWTGGKKSSVPTAQTGGENYLQIMQCWGDDPKNQGQPDRTTCQYGGFNTAGASRDSFVKDSSVAPQDVDYTAPGSGFAVPTYTSIPFKPAEGPIVASVVDKKKVDVDPNTNQYFTRLTTNEIPWAGSGSNGEGSAKFETQTAAQSPGLGCGAPKTSPKGDVTGKPCWLVIIPRGEADVDEQDIIHSGLFWDSWKHKLAVRLDFRPVGVNCTIGAAERQLSGSELVAGAVASWQPSLCGGQGGTAFTLLRQTESDAILSANGTQTQPLALTSRPLAVDGVTDKLAYAPVALTGLAITFSIDRAPKASDTVPAEIQARARLPFTSMKLTPRLVAKLLTGSYLDALPANSDRSHLGTTNARNLTTDPEFLAINDPEWADQAIVSPAVADLLTPQGRLDGATVLWSYVMADPDAAAFLAGTPDASGMTVNPWSSTNPATNPSGTGLSMPLDTFPKTDPVESSDPNKIAGPVNLVTWRPYTNDLDTSAYLTLRGDGQVLGDWNPTSTPPKYGKSSRSIPGQQAVLGLTDTASADRYQVYTASLLNPAGQYVAPDAAGLSAAAAAMTASSSQSQVYGFDAGSDAAKGAPGAYPLAMPVYAAVNPAMTDKEVRADYAAFIRYAATAGQEPGTGAGQLPVGYAPIPSGWQQQALAAADVVEAGGVAPPSPTPTSAPPAAQAAAPAAAQNAAPAAPAVPAAQAPAPAADPVASGTATTNLIGKATPVDQNLGAITAVVPLSILAGLVAAIAVAMLGRIRRRL